PADIDRDDVGALLRQTHGVTAPLTAGGTADESYLPFYPPIHPTCHRDTSAGMHSQPRTVEVGLRVARLRSTSHSGNRFRISSSATRPSRRASAEPRQKCVPMLKVRCGRTVR